MKSIRSNTKELLYNVVQSDLATLQKKSKDGFQTCLFSTNAHLGRLRFGSLPTRLIQVDPWEVASFCKVKCDLPLQKTLTKQLLPTSDKCLVTCQNHKYFRYFSRAYLKAVYLNSQVLYLKYC